MQFQFGVIVPGCQQIREVVLKPSQAAALVHDDEFAFDSGIVVAGRRLAPERTLIGSSGDSPEASPALPCMEPCYALKPHLHEAIGAAPQGHERLPSFSGHDVLP